MSDRLWRLDAFAQIRQLALRYAAAMASQDSETLGNLYVDDVRAGGGRTGREALREAYFGSALTRLDLSVLHVGTHVIDLDPERDDRARGSWIRQAICYFDRYACRDGQWLFVTRDHQLFYGADHDRRPNALPPANWPAADTGTGTLPYAWPTWPTPP